MPVHRSTWGELEEAVREIETEHNQEVVHVIEAPWGVSIITKKRAGRPRNASQPQNYEKR